MIFIFDIGNVLVNFDMQKILQNISVHSQVTVNELRTFYYSTELLKVETGKISGREYFTKLAEMTGLKWNYQDWIHAWVEIYETNETGLNLLKQVKAKNFPAYILSNLAEYHSDALKIKTPEVLNETQFNFFSFELGNHKPDPGIYQYVCARLAVDPEKCVFLDDMPENVAGAQSIGMHGIVYNNERIKEINTEINKIIESTA
jgi:FMN phosphatase YigB (HAD superfamily)